MSALAVCRREDRALVSVWSRRVFLDREFAGTASTPPRAAAGSLNSTAAGSPTSPPKRGARSLRRPSRRPEAQRMSPLAAIAHAPVGQAAPAQGLRPTAEGNRAAHGRGRLPSALRPAGLAMVALPGRRASRRPDGREIEGDGRPARVGRTSFCSIPRGACTRWN